MIPATPTAGGGPTLDAMAERLQGRGWAVFAPSGAVSWRSFETSREASITAFAPGSEWSDFEAAGYRCVELVFTPVCRPSPPAAEAPGLVDVARAKEAIETIRSSVGQYAEAYDTQHIGLGAYEACSRVLKLLPALDAALSIQTGGADAAAGGATPYAYAVDCGETGDGWNVRIWTAKRRAEAEGCAKQFGVAVLPLYAGRIAAAGDVDAPVAEDAEVTSRDEVDHALHTLGAIIIELPTGERRSDSISALGVLSVADSRFRFAAAAPPASRPTAPVDRVREALEQIVKADQHREWMGDADNYPGDVHGWVVRDGQYAKLARAALDKADDGAAAGADDGSVSCSDCPPIGYSTGRTRCVPCPRRFAPPADRSAGPQTGEASTVETMEVGRG